MSEAVRPDLWSIPPSHGLTWESAQRYRPVQPPAAPGSMTSALAAEKAIPKVKGQCEWVLNYLRSNGPASRQTLSHVLNLSENSVRPRVRRLLDLGLIQVVGRGITTDGNECELLGLA